MVRFGKGRIGGIQRAIDFVSRDMEELESGLGLAIELKPVSAHRLQKAKSAGDFGLDELLGIVNRAVYVAFGGKIEHGPWLMLGEQTGDKRAVTDIALHKGVPCVTLQGCKGARVLGC